MLAELKTTDSSNKIQSFYTKEEEYDLVYITVILLAVLLDSWNCRGTIAFFSEEWSMEILIQNTHPVDRAWTQVATLSLFQGLSPLRRFQRE